ncbi:hypothetical protein [Rufibacter roseus]|uniref:Uncharacterized protein n=1 Tax=Rufibacter roseus TaxID=1567108 RepID=A0ABW2DR42_9BACT|nr:hypothetical protein [Rufibacter roseus]
MAWVKVLEVRKQNGILPGEESFKASSAFDVKKISNSNPKQMGVHLTKNKVEF